MKKSGKTLVAFIGLSLVVLVLSSCSGMIGGYDGLEVRVNGLSNGRYISPSANSGYIVLLQKNKIFSLNIIDGSPYSAWILPGGIARIPSIPVGDYILGIVLMDDNGTPSDLQDDTNYGLAIKEISIKKGYNSVIVDVGPGISSFQIGGVDFDDFLTPDGYEVGFEEDTVIIYTNQAGTISLTYQTGGTGSVPASPGPGDNTVTFNATVALTNYSLTVKRVAP